MRRNSTLNTEETKRLARNKYAERQIDKWVKWSWNMRGKVLYRELMEKIKQDMQSIGRVELQPKFDGKQMIMVIQPL